MHPFLDNGLTSDHAYQSLCIYFSEQHVKPQIKAIDDLRPIHVATWNLQDLCIGRSDRRRFSNNPFNYNEDFDAYRYRKQQQIDKIAAYLRLEDIIFLQEVDFLFHDAPVFYDVNPQLIQIQQELATLFHQKLAENNFGIIISPHSFVRGFGTQKLVTLFDQEKFIFQNSAPVFLTEMPFGYSLHRGLELILQEGKTGRLVIATNVHLKYGESPVPAIQSYQDSYRDHLTIIGGDTNHVDADMLNLALGGYSHATNFSMDEDGHLTTFHKDRLEAAELPKSYDRIFVKSSPELECHFTINAERCEMVEIFGEQPRIFPVDQLSQVIREFAESALAYSLDRVRDNPGRLYPSEPNLVTESCQFPGASPVYYTPQPERAAYLTPMHPVFFHPFPVAPVEFYSPQPQKRDKLIANLATTSQGDIKSSIKTSEKEEKKALRIASIFRPAKESPKSKRKSKNPIEQQLSLSTTEGNQVKQPALPSSI